MISRSLLGSISRHSAIPPIPNLSGLVVCPVQRLRSLSLRQISSSSYLNLQDLGAEMVKNKGKKGIKRKVPTSQKNNFQSDLTKARLESAALSQQQEQLLNQNVGQPSSSSSVPYPTAMDNRGFGQEWSVPSWAHLDPNSYPQVPPGTQQWTYPTFAPQHMMGSGPGYPNNTAPFGNSTTTPFTSYSSNRLYSTMSSTAPSYGEEPQNNLPAQPQQSPPQHVPTAKALAKRERREQRDRRLQQEQERKQNQQPYQPRSKRNRPYHNKDQQHEESVIKAPSPQSGGVPEPTPAYFLRASFLPREVSAPRPILVVIDLNGTMLFRPSRKAPSKFIERPHARQFLEYCISTFHVAIWSSARPDNIDKMLNQLLTPEQRSAVVAVWGRDKFGLTVADYNQRTMCYKRLTKLWADPAVVAAHPHGELWNQGNTVLIDDTIEKARSEPYNAITLPEFEGNVDEEPEVLPLVHDYLNKLALQADISTYIRTNPFKLGSGEGEVGGERRNTDAISVSSTEDAMAPATGASGNVIMLDN